VEAAAIPRRRQRQAAREPPTVELACAPGLPSRARVEGSLHRRAAGPIANIVEALARVLPQAGTQQAADTRRSLRGIRLGLNYGSERLAYVLSFEGTFAREHFIEHHAEGPDVGALVNVLTPSLLRGSYRQPFQGSCLLR